MKIWNLQIGEPRAFLPDKGKTARVGRAHALSLLFSSNGHDVTHFVSRFNHQERKLETPPYNVELPSIHPRLNYVILRSSGYKKNVSVKRIVDHTQCANSFRKFIRSNTVKPDLIIASVPTIELAFVAVLFAKKNGIRVVIDFRDLWPDIFVHHFLPNTPRLAAFLTKLLPWYWMNRYVFKNASLVTTVGHGFSRYAKNRYLANSNKPVIKKIYQAQRELKTAERPVRTGSSIRFIWTGNIVKETDFVTLKESIKILTRKRLDFEIWIAGSGKILEDETLFFEKYHRHVKLLGWLSESELIKALNACDVGLLCYLDRLDFRMAIQNKVVDYLRSGLPIIGSVNGELRELAQSEGRDVYHLYEFGNSYSLAKVMEKFIDNGVSDDAREQCKRIYKDNFRLEKVEQDWLSILGTLDHNV